MRRFYAKLPQPLRRASEALVRARKPDIVIVCTLEEKFERGKVDRIEAAQVEPVGKVAGAPSQGLVHIDRLKPRPVSIEPGHKG